jgi:PAS domain S-box-containing protein
MDESLKHQLDGLFSDLQVSTQAEKHLAAQKEAARESAARYLRLVENLPVGVYRVTPSPQGNLLIANSAFRNLFGIDSEETLERTTLADLVVNPAEHAAFFDRLVADRNVASCTLPFKKLDGTLILGLVTASAAYASGGEAAYFDCVIEDVLDCQPAETESDLWKLRYDIASVALGQVVYDYDTATGSILWSDSLEPVLGYDPAQMKGGIAQWADLTHPEDRGALIGELDLAEEKCVPYEVEYRFRHKNGDYVWMRDRGVFVPNSAGKAARRIGTLQGITGASWTSTPIRSRADPRGSNNPDGPGRSDRHRD